MESPLEREGGLIGPYKLIEKIGEGGFGEVWLADQREPVRRKVALKIVKLGMDTRQVVARFEAERQALALMDHPNIAKVHDGGATSLGRPFFVMEWVKGITITEYCQSHRTLMRERLELFILVCRAIQHAHQKGIVHRDIKPSNILVAMQDGVPIPKVIDFGIAKAMQMELTEKTLHTHLNQFVGTPAYMSPEQAGLTGIDIDTRSDIYSLGVLLYELLTGATPFDNLKLLSAGLDGMRRTIREKDPVRPSTRLSQLREADRGGRAHHLLRQVTGDLDWIVMKCLEKDRTRRYETANGLAADLARLMNHEPVTARPPSAGYRMRKAWRRNRLAFSSLAAVVVALAAGFGTSFRHAVRATRAEHRAMDLAQRERLAREAEGAARAEAEAQASIVTRNLYYDRIALVQRELTSQPTNVRLAEQLLEQCPTALRNWEWRFLKRRRFAEPFVLDDAATRVVHSVAFSQDGRFLASGGSDGTVKIWDPATARLLKTLGAHRSFVAAVSFSPANSALIASIGNDGALRLWDWAAERALQSWPALARREYGMSGSIAFSPDGQRLGHPAADGQVIVRSLENGQPQFVLPGHGEGAYSLSFSPDHRLIATGSAQGQVRLWKADAGEPLAILHPGGPPIAGLRFTSDSSRVVALRFDGSIFEWEAASGRELRNISTRTSGRAAVGLAVSPEGDRFFRCGLDQFVTVVEPSSSRPVLVLRDSQDPCFALAISLDGHRLAAANRAGKVFLWDGSPLTGREDLSTKTIEYPAGEVWSMAVGPDGTLAFGGYTSQTNLSTGPIFIYRSQHDTKPALLEANLRLATWLDIDPAGKCLVTCGIEPQTLGRANVWNLAGDKLFEAEPFENKDRIFAAAFHPAGRWLAGVAGDGRVLVWHAADGKKAGLLGTHDGEVNALAFSPKGKHLATIGTDDLVKVWDASRMLERQTNSIRFPARTAGSSDLLAFSPDENRLAYCKDDDALSVRSLDPLGDDLNLPCVGHRPSAVAFSPDGRILASGGADCAVRIWDPKTGKVVRILRSHLEIVTRLKFVQQAGSTVLISASRDGAVKFWKVGELLGAAN